MFINLFWKINCSSKRELNPVFFGGSFKTEIPINENKYGFSASKLYTLSVSFLTKEIDFIKGSFGARSSLSHTTKAYWNGKKAPNSQATILTLGAGGIWSLGSGTLGINLEKPFFLMGAFSGIESEQKQRVGSLQVSIGYRKLFNFNIPWLDPLKNIK